MKYRLSAIHPSASAALVLGLGLACSQTPPAEAPSQPEASESSGEAQAEAAAPAAPVVVKDVGFQTPESVWHEVASDVYLVSNINGDPFGKDDNGFISKVSPDGQLLELKWIDGASAEVELNAPKGMGVANGKLYVADIDVIRTFDLATGKPLASTPVEGASFLNDVTAAPDGSVYVSDTGMKEGFAPSQTDAIYKVSSGGELSTLIKGEELGQPNGVYADDSGVWVATWQGQIYRVGYDGNKEAPISAPGTQLDGLFQAPDGQVLVSSWEKSMLYLGKDGQFSPLVSEVKSPADFGYDAKRGQVLVPLFSDNQLVIHKLPQLTSSAPPQSDTGNATAEAQD